MVFVASVAPLQGPAHGVNAGVSSSPICEETSYCPLMLITEKSSLVGHRTHHATNPALCSQFERSSFQTNLRVPHLNSPPLRLICLLLNAVLWRHEPSQTSSSSTLQTMTHTVCMCYSRPETNDSLETR